jgi:uncharacterized membrane protein
MNRSQFLAELAKLLENLPPEERSNALAYYEEYLIDAGPEGEAEAIAALGSPAQVAAEIIGAYGLQQSSTPAAEASSGSLKVLWVVLLGIFAAPIVLPVAIVLFAIAITLIACIAVVVVSFFITALALVLGGIAGIVMGIIALLASPINGIFTIGAGMVMASLGAMLFVGAIELGRLCVRGLTYLFSKLLKKKGAKK